MLNDQPNPRLNGHHNGTYNGEMHPTSASQGKREVLDDEIDLGRLFAVLFNRKWLILGVTLAAAAVSMAYIFTARPIYQSDGSFLVSQAGNRYSMAGSDLSNLLISNFGVGMGSTIENELEVMRSRQFSYELAKRIHEERLDRDGRLFPLLWRDFPEDSSLVAVDTVFARIATQLSFNRPDRMSDLISISFQSPSPQEAQRLVNLSIATYTDVSTRINRAQARSAIEFLEEEQQKVELDVVAAEERMRDFMNRERLVQLDKQTEELIVQMSELEAERRSVDVRLTAVQSAIDSYTRELETIRPGLSSQINEGVAPMLTRLQYRLAELETEKVLLLSKNPSLNENSQEPQLLTLNREISRVRQEITQLTAGFLNGETADLGFLTTTDGGFASRANEYRLELIRLDIEQKQLSAQADVMDERLEEFQAFFNDLPDNMIQLAQLRREMQMNEALFVIISQQSAEMQLWEQTQSGLARVVDYASLPALPVKPNKQLVLLIGLVLGFISAVAFVLIREYTVVEINNVDKLQKKGLPLLSVVPDIQSMIKKDYNGAEFTQVEGRMVGTDLVMALDPISPVSESYRRLQANVIYSHPDDRFKTLIITSSNKSEGKTTICANLAVALAESGKRVCMVDCDFRRPRLHKIMGATQQPGLTDVLFNEVTLTEAVQETLVPSVSLLASGMRPPNPAQVIRSRKLYDLLQSLKEHYDHVLIDSAPFGIISDVAPLFNLADGVILAVRFNKAKEPELDLTLENLQKVKANLIGVVMTAFDHKKTTGYHYSSYYYKYNYDSYTSYQEAAT